MICSLEGSLRDGIDSRVQDLQERADETGQALEALDKVISWMRLDGYNDFESELAHMRELRLQMETERLEMKARLDLLYTYFSANEDAADFESILAAVSQSLGEKQGELMNFAKAVLEAQLDECAEIRAIIENAKSTE